jgi:nucleotide-binding universal stress UspA family protein
VTVPETTVHAGGGFPGLSTMSADVVQQVIDELGAEAQRQAGETAQQAGDRARALGLKADVVPVDPSAAAWAALLAAARRLGAEVLACGTRGRGAFARALLGSTSSTLLHHTDVPLLVVPDGSGTLDGPVVAAYDGSQGATRAIQVVGRLLDGRPSVVVHAWEPVIHRSLKARALAVGPVDDVHAIVADLHEALGARASARTQEGVAAARRGSRRGWRDSRVGGGRMADRSRRRADARGVGHRHRHARPRRRAIRASRLRLVGLIQNAELPILVVPEEPAAATADQNG